MRPLVSTTGKDVHLRPVRPNAGIEAAYRKRLFRLVDDMHRSILYWISATYRANEPLLAADATPAYFLRKSMAELRARWQKKFDDGAMKLAEAYADKIRRYTDGSLGGALRDAGFSIKFKMNAPMKDAYQAVIGEQVGLIRSIASEHLTQVETLVMQSVQTGRKLDELAEQLQARFKVTKKRAALIARDQNNKATATLTRTRQLTLGITEARWRHSSAGKVPRPSHVAAGRQDGGRGQRYKIAEGCLIDGQHILPGELINCRCVAAAIIPGIEE
jgi:uncharacterized protein with gpF-like domain